MLLPDTAVNWRILMTGLHSIASTASAIAIRSASVTRLPCIAQLLDPFHDLFYLVIVGFVIHLVEGCLDRSRTGMLSEHDTAFAPNHLGFDRFVGRWFPHDTMGMDAALMGERHLTDNCLVDRQRDTR